MLNSICEPLIGTLIKSSCSQAALRVLDAHVLQVLDQRVTGWLLEAAL